MILSPGLHNMMQKRLFEIFHPGVIAVRPGDMAQEAIHLMRERTVSCVVVLEEGKPAGIFTERDLVRCVAEHNAGFRERPMAEIMSRDVLCVQAEAFLYEAFHLLSSRRIRHLVVVDGAGRAVGMVTQSNLIAHLGYEYFVKVKTVSQIMHKAVVTVRPEASAHEASRIMADGSLSFLVVGAQESPEGVLTERDVTRLAAEGRDVRATKVREVMSAPVVSVRSDAPVFEAAERMSEKGVRRLVVVDESGAAVGVTTQTDLVRGLESKYVDALKRIIVDQGEELNRAIHELTAKSLYLESILSSSIDMGIAATDASGRVVYFNPAAERILGCAAAAALGRELDLALPPEEMEAGRLASAMDTVRQGRPQSFSFERLTPDGPLSVHVRLSGIRCKGQVAGFVLMLLDVTEQRRAEETIRRLAYYDVLTDLPNRALFNERLALELAHCRRHKARLALMVMDLDCFKEVNDTLGHAAGDELLRGVAGRLRGMLRESDTVARIGGDEFALIVPAVADPDDAMAVARKVLASLEAPVAVEGTRLAVRLSVGVALYPEHGEDILGLMRNADSAMYRAKERGHAEGTSNADLCRDA